MGSGEEKRGRRVERIRGMKWKGGRVWFAGGWVHEKT